MTDTLRSRLERLRAARDQEFLETLATCIVEDFEATYEFIRTQRVPLRWRDAANAELAMGQVREASRHWRLTSKQRSRIRRHFEISLAFQRLFDDLNARGSTLKGWHLPTDQFVLRILSYLDTDRTAREFEYLRQHIAGSGPAGPDPDRTVRDVELARHGTRITADCAIRLIQHKVRAYADLANAQSLSAEELSELFFLADQEDLLQQIVDTYSLNGVNIVVSRDGITVGRVAKDRGHGLDTVSLRRNAMDIDARHELERASRAWLFYRSPEDFPAAATFADFLDSPRGSELYERAADLTGHWLQMNSQEISQYLDIQKKVATRYGRMTLQNYLRAWSAIFRLARCARIWQLVACRAGATGSPIPILARERVSDTLSTHLPSQENPAKFLSMLTTDLSPRDPIDLFYRPLIAHQGQYIVGVTFAESARLSRNAVIIALRETDFEVSGKGSRPLTHIEEVLRAAGFRTARSIPVRRRDGSAATDIDLAAQKGKCLFLWQVKVIVPNDTHHEAWKAEKTLQSAAAQLATPESYNEGTRQLLVERCGEFDTIIPMILTNLIHFTGQRIGIYPVVDFDYLLRICEKRAFSTYDGFGNKTRSVSVPENVTDDASVFERALTDPIFKQLIQEPRVEYVSRALLGRTVKIPVITW